MKRTSIKLNNIIFPIWILWLFPITWIVVLPANFIVDLLVVTITLKFLKVENIKHNAKVVILRVWILGFIADFIGTVAMLLSNIIDFDYDTKLGRWWHTNITSAVSYNPFESIFGVLWVTVCVIITAFLIYIFNYKFCLNRSDLDNDQKKKLAMSLAIFTAPYLFYLPTSWFY